MESVTRKHRAGEIFASRANDADRAAQNEPFDIIRYRQALDHAGV